LKGKLLVKQINSRGQFEFTLLSDKLTTSSLI